MIPQCHAYLSKSAFGRQFSFGQSARDFTAFVLISNSITCDPGCGFLYSVYFFRTVKENAQLTIQLIIRHAISDEHFSVKILKIVDISSEFLFIFGKQECFCEKISKKEYHDLHFYLIVNRQNDFIKLHDSKYRVLMNKLTIKRLFLAASMSVTVV